MCSNNLQITINMNTFIVNFHIAIDSQTTNTFIDVCGTLVSRVNHSCHWITSIVLIWMLVDISFTNKIKEVWNHLFVNSMSDFFAFEFERILLQFFLCSSNGMATNLTILSIIGIISIIFLNLDNQWSHQLSPDL